LQSTLVSALSSHISASSKDLQIWHPFGIALPKTRCHMNRRLMRYCEQLADAELERVSGGEGWDWLRLPGSGDPWRDYLANNYVGPSYDRTFDQVMRMPAPLTPMGEAPYFSPYR
jgi:hypothetical protein